jgi:hypothetical protein
MMLGVGGEDEHGFHVVAVQQFPGGSADDCTGKFGRGASCAPGDWVKDRREFQAIGAVAKSDLVLVPNVAGAKHADGKGFHG